jgi:hypothetical protein
MEPYGPGARVASQLVRFWFWRRHPFAGWLRSVWSKAQDIRL